MAAAAVNLQGGIGPAAEVELYDPPIAVEGAISPEKLRALVMRYLIASTVIFLVAGALGTIIRQSQAGVIQLNDTVWYALMTTHGLGAFVGWAAFALMGITWWILDEVGLPLRKWGYWFAEAAWWTMVVGVVGVVITTISMAVGPSWVALYPLPLVSAGAWTDWGAGLFAGSVLVAGLSIFAYCFGVLAVVTGPALGAPAGYGWWRRLGCALGWGMLSKKFATDRRVPFPVLPFTVIAIDMIIATTPFAVLLVLMIVEAVVPSVTVDPLLAKFMLWWFGHPVVYLLLFPAVGVYYHLVPKFAGRPLVAGHVIAVGWLIGVIANVIIGAHHMYLDFPNDLQQVVNTWSQPLTYAVTIPSALSLFSLGLTIYRSPKWEWNVSTLFLASALMSWIVAGFQGVMLATISYDVFAHNTLWIVGHFHNMALLHIGSVIFAAVYAGLPKLVGRPWASRSLCTWHWVLTMVGGYGSVVMWMWEGLDGAPRRWAVLPTNIDGSDRYIGTSQIAVLFVLLIVVGQLLFAVNFARTVGVGWVREQVGVKAPSLATSGPVARERGIEALSALLAAAGAAVAIGSLWARPFTFAPIGAALALVAARTGAPRQGMWAFVFAVLMLVVGFVFHGFS